MLDRIQYEASRLILGALRPTPTNKLEAETDLIPLYLRRQQLLTQYGGRVCTVPNHPVANALTNHFNFQHLSRGSYMLSSIGRMSDCLQTLTTSPIKQPVIPISLRYMPCAITVRTSLAELNPKTAQFPQQWKTAFQELCNSQYSQSTHVYTDGSADGKLVGCAVWCSDFTLSCRLPSHSSVFTSELYAIYSALKFLEQRPGKYVIFSDSLAALRAIQAPRTNSNYLVYWINTAGMKLKNHSISLE